MRAALLARLPGTRAGARVNPVDIVLWVLRIGVVLVVVIGTIGTLIKGRYDAAQWFDFVVFGLTIGSIYAQIALGYTMVYGVLRLINFAHGDFVMCGAFAGYFVAGPLDRSGFLSANPVLGMAAILAVSVATSTAIAVLAERIAYRPFRRVAGLAPLICTIGVSFFLEQTFRGMFGSAVKAYPDPVWGRSVFHLFGFSLPRIDVVVIVLALVFMAALYLVVQKTRMGTAMRAVAEDGEAAALMGIDVNKVVVFTFVLGGVMAGIAGVFYAFVYKQVYFFMGFTPGVKAFGAAVLGGIGSIPGAMLGGFFLGLVESVGPSLFLDGLGIPAPVPAPRSHRLHPAHHGADLPPAGHPRREARQEARVSSARRPLLIGLAFGAGALHLAAVGVLLMLHQRWIIVHALSLGQAALLLIALGAGAMAARRAGLLAGALAGCAVALPIAALLLLMSAIRLQSIFIALTPELRTMLDFGLAPTAGAALLLVSGAIIGFLSALLRHLPSAVTRILLPGAAAVLVAGVFQELIQLMLQQYTGIISTLQDLLYTWEGLTPQGAAIVFVLAALIAALAQVLRTRRASSRPRERQRWVWAGIALAVLVLLPIVAGNYIGQVLMLVGLYILMGMGLNLEVGLAGLLDLGFVAFFAVGAYTTALLTADSPHALMALPYWGAMPIAVLLSVCVGVIFGIPVLGVRGDYLAVATMGLGEIVRVIVQSDFAAPLLGGAQGILQIPKPVLGHFVLGSPVALFYLTLVCSAVAALIAWRLENSRLGRAWMALRDDEDVAQALGINLIRSKLLAYGLGAAFAGLAGSIFATMLTSVYPSSFQLLISINVLALIIVGGMGSLPGVVLGAIALIGLPELLREFGEYRYLFYGAILVVMMRLRPEGLWPSDIRQRELHDADATLVLDAGTDPLPAQNN